MKIRIVLLVDVDADCWQEIYGPHGTVRDDVRGYVLGLVQDSAATDARCINSAELDKRVS